MSPLKGFKHTKETKQKMSEVCKGAKNPFYGRHHSEESKRKISEGQMGDKNQFYGKKHTEETKRKIGEMETGEKNHFAKEYTITTPEGTELYIKGLRKFCREHNLTHELMSRVARGIQTHHKGYKCIYYNGKI